MIPRVRNILGVKMLITEIVETKWNSKTKKYYESLGYQYTKMGDVFKVGVIDLKDTSAEIVEVQCDYCGKRIKKKWKEYTFSKSSPIKKDACNKCKHVKAKETMMARYGEAHSMNISEFKEKQRNTVRERYGVDNTFQSEEIKNKILQTNLEKYGETSFTKTDEYIRATRQTCLKKYGATSYTKTKEYKKKYSGTGSAVWKGGKKDPRWERMTNKYKTWRNSVFSKNKYICQRCNKKSRELEAHHIKNWNDNPDFRYDPQNGITLCRRCHSLFHSKYGKKDNTEEQLFEFLQKDEKICRTTR
jgi:5-methylcytosine-specific restriction endonuclease McrA